MMPRTGKTTPEQLELGERIRKRRKELGLSQMDLAARIDLHFTFVSSVERGERNVSLQSILRLAKGLDVNPGLLVDDLDTLQTEKIPSSIDKEIV